MWERLSAAILLERPVLNLLSNKICKVDDASRRLPESAIDKLGLSAQILLGIRCHG
jgi:hypothetical protein